MRNEEVAIEQEIAIDTLLQAKKNYARNQIVLKIEKVLKRTIDIIGGVFGGLLLIPITLGVFIANRMIGDRGPIFYVQERIGKNGKLFKMYKYRSMVVGAEEILEKYLEENVEARREYKKLKRDPRTTKVGRFIRKTSLDEFPQFINVLKGQMSLVGPRPYLPSEKKDMNGFYKQITSCKPGLTGFWQVNGRSDVTFNDRLDLDMNYYYNHCLKLDLKILKKTVEKFVKREGAI